MLRLKALFTLRLKLILAFAAVIVLAVLLNAHDNKDTESTPTKGLILSTTESETTAPADISKGETADSAEDYTYIILADEMTTINGKGASFSDNQVTITKGGTYLFKGGLSNGKICVDLKSDKEKVVLKLCGVGITSTNSAAIIIKNAPKSAVIHLAEGTINSLSDTAERAEIYRETDEDSSVIFSKNDLIVEGKGNLNISAGFNKGIFSKKSIKIKDASINILSADDGIRSKNSIELEDGKVKITSGGDGIRTKSDKENITGKIVSRGSEITILSELDGIQSEGELLFYSGKLDIISRGGSTGRHSDKNTSTFFEEPKSPTEDKNLLFALRKATLDSSALEGILHGGTSLYGIRAEGRVVLDNSTVSVSSVDDSVYGESIKIKKGYCSLQSDDNGLHAAKNVSIDGGEVNIADSYEGIKCQNANVKDGRVFIKAYNKGFYAQKGQENYSVKIDSSYVHIDSDGKGEKNDSEICLSGGTLIVSDSGNNALSSDLYTVQSGTLLVLSNAPMAKNIKGENVPVIAFTQSRKENALTVIADSKGESVMGFSASKTYKNVVFASDSLKADEYYSLYEGGNFDSEPLSGIYSSGNYSGGTLLRKLSKPLINLDKTEQK